MAESLSLDASLICGWTGTVRFAQLRSLQAFPVPDKNMSPPDRALVLGIQAGRTDWIETLVFRYSHRLYRVILRLVQSPGTAEDILQDTWIKVVRKMHQCDPEGCLSAWLTRIAVNNCRDFWRRQQRRRLWERSVKSGWQPGLKKGGAAAGADADGENRLGINKALVEISPKLREVVVLKFYSGMTYEEISEVLGVPVGTVKSRLHFALTKLRERLMEEGQGS